MRAPALFCAIIQPMILRGNAFETVMKDCYKRLDPDEEQLIEVFLV